MPIQSKAIPASQVVDFLEGLNKAAELDTAQLQQRRDYRHAAAVLAGIEDINSLKPVGSTSVPTGANKLLHDDLIPVRAAKLGGRVMLSADVRRQALLELA